MTLKHRAGFYALSASEGTVLRYLGSEMRVKASKEQSESAYTLLEWARPDEGGSPSHVHEREDEAFYILEGMFTITCGDEVLIAGPGSFVFLPRGVPHRVTFGPAGGRTLILCSPGGFEQYCEELNEAALTGTLNQTRHSAIARKYGVGHIALPTAT